MSHRLRAFSVAVLMAAANSVAAQNLIENPSFDTDATGWTTGPWTTWSPRQDHTPATLGLGGSLQIDTGLPDSAQQCFAVKPNTNYIFSTWFDTRSDERFRSVLHSQQDFRDSTGTTASVRRRDAVPRPSSRPW